MEHEMKISPNTIRRLRSDKGWPQDQLAKVSGLSLRTIQRVEAEGVGSINTAVSLAATFGVDLKDLQEELQESVHRKLMFRYGSLFIGLMVITVAGLSESGRLPGPQSDLFVTVNILGLLIGLLATVPALAYALRYKQYIEVGLFTLGTPLVTLLVGSGIYWLVNGKSPSLILFLFGAGGGALLFMALKEIRHKIVKV